MKFLDTVVGRFFPLAQPDPDPDHSFDFWRLPNDPDSPHVGAMRDLFAEIFDLPAESFDEWLKPVPGLRRLLIVAARKHLICGGILYQMADNYGKPPEERVDGGYVAYIATNKSARAQGAGRALLDFAHADLIVNDHQVSRLIRLDPKHSSFFEAAGYERTEGGTYGDMHKDLDLSEASKAESQALLNGLMTLY